MVAKASATPIRADWPRLDRSSKRTRGARATRTWLTKGRSDARKARQNNAAAASRTRAQAMRAAEWHEHGLARRLRHHADLLDARLVDPLWRVFASRALQIAA